MSSLDINSTSGNSLTTKAIREIGYQTASWSGSYIDTVFRTNLASAYYEGRQAQAKDPNLKGWVVGWEWQAVGDSDTRDNHNAADGLIWSIDDEYTNSIMRLPRGYNCRCTHRMVVRDEAVNTKILEHLENKRVLRRRGGKFRVLPAVPKSAMPTAEEMTFIGKGGAAA